MFEAIFLSSSILCTFIIISLPNWRSVASQLQDLSRSYKTYTLYSVLKALFRLPPWTQVLEDSHDRKRTENIKKIKALVEQHEVAEVLEDLIHKDGAGSWPPRANHSHSTWPVALQAYKEIYLQLASLLPEASASIDDEVNRAKVHHFRSQYQRLLHERVPLHEVIQVSNLQNSPCSSNNFFKSISKLSYLLALASC